MLGPIFDTHAHYNSAAFDADRDAVLAALPSAGVVGVCECATDSADALRAVALAKQYPFVYAAVGIHPESLMPDSGAATQTVYHGDWKAELTAMTPLLDEKKVVAIGECGLDRHWPVPDQAQLDMLEAHLQLAAEKNMPVILHDREAHGSMYELLRHYQPKGILHCFSGSAEDAAWLTGQGMYLGFGGSVTFKGAKRAVKAALATPPEQMLLETDCPYMTPVPCRGQRNDSRMIAHVGVFLAELLGCTPDQLFAQTAANARRVLEIENEGISG